MHVSHSFFSETDIYALYLYSIYIYIYVYFYISLQVETFSGTFQVDLLASCLWLMKAQQYAISEQDTTGTQKETNNLCTEEHEM